MAEYRTRRLDRPRLLAEVDALVRSLGDLALTEADISFGWDSNQDIETMWQPRTVELASIAGAIGDAESTYLAVIGESDIFVEVPGLLLTLCHEGDLHVEGSLFVVGELAIRWLSLGYEPYAVLSVPSPTFQGTAARPLS